MKVLITGAGGFVGGYVVRALREAGHGVRALDRSRRDHGPDVESCVADLAGDDPLEPAFADIDAVIHLAASMHGSLDEMTRNTLGGTRRLLEAMSRTATRRLIHASSFTVYRRDLGAATLNEQSPIHDESSLEAGDHYAQVKVRQEALVRELTARHGWDLTVLRPAVIWGRGQWGPWLVGPRIGPLQAVVAPRAAARLAYVEHVADAFVKSVETPHPGERIVNVVDDPHTTIWRWAGVVCRQRGGVRLPVCYGAGLLAAKLASALTGGAGKLPYFLRPARYAAMHRPMTWTNAALRERLGWSPRYTFDQAVARATGPVGSDR